jgi:hypothetical protein
MSECRVNGFFYGLFMDVAVLRNNGAMPTDPRPPYVDDFESLSASSDIPGCFAVPEKVVHPW